MWGREPLLSRRGSRRGGSDDDDVGCCGTEYANDVGCCEVCVICASRSCGVRCFCLLLVVAIAFGSFWIGVSRNLYCDPDALLGIDPPFDGQLLPANFSLVERKWLWFQFTKLVDVYADDLTHVGYFYDINLFIIMRFGFSDASGRIWFEARYASFISRFKPIVEYTLQRCDAGYQGRSSPLFQMKEDWWDEWWLCLFHCKRLFGVSRREATSQVEEHLLPPPGFAQDPSVLVRFDSRLIGTQRPGLKVDGAVAPYRFRSVWSMRLMSEPGGEVIASARQRFSMGTALTAVASNGRLLSRWSVTTLAEEYGLPHWVIGYFATLDDIEEDDAASWY